MSLARMQSATLSTCSSESRSAGFDNKASDRASHFAVYLLIIFAQSALPFLWQHQRWHLTEWVLLVGGRSV